MLLIKKKAQYLFQSPALCRFDGLFHAVSCRDGGHSPPPYDGMNLSTGVGDDAHAVKANRRYLQRLTGGVHVYARQNHGTGVHVITRETTRDPNGILTAPVPADALVTDVRGVHLVIQTADCQSVMLYDPRNGVVANIHSGWRGSVANIIARTIGVMRERFGCDPARMTAAIGPSLGPCCAEFINYAAEIPASLWAYRVGRHHFDFWQISRRQLADTGVPPAQVHTAGICTRCNPHLFYSYRAARQTGRFAALIGMNGTLTPRTSSHA